MGERGSGEGDMQGTSSRVEKQKHLPFICVPFCIIKMCSLLFSPPFPLLQPTQSRSQSLLASASALANFASPLFPHLLSLLFVCLPACYILLGARVCGCVCVWVRPVCATFPPMLNFSLAFSICPSLSLSHFLCSLRFQHFLFFSLFFRPFYVSFFASLRRLNKVFSA